LTAAVAAAAWRWCQHGGGGGGSAAAAWRRGGSAAAAATIGRVVARSSPSAAYAATSKKKKRAGGGGGGGFGSPSTTTTTAGGRRGSEGAGRAGPDDAFVYPDLEPRVAATLVPYRPADGGSPPPTTGGGGGGGGGGALPVEMYDRLGAIYGLGKFNFGGDSAADARAYVAGGGTVPYDDDGGDGAGLSSLFDDILSRGGFVQIVLGHF
jgi:hypothetical protein